MSVPSFRNSRSKVRRRRSHHALSPVQAMDCAKCGATVKPHNACTACGNYNNREAIAVKTEAPAPAEKPAKAEAPKKPAEKKEADKKAEKETK